MMQYFTAEEARAILNCTSMWLCFNDEGNPNCAAFSEAVRASELAPNSRWFAAAMGFLLGVATGKREERARRRAASTIH